MNEGIQLRFVSAVGLLCMIGVAWAFSEKRRAINWRLVLWGVGLQVALGVILLRTRVSTWVFDGMRHIINALNDATLEGSRFVFGTVAEKFSIAGSALMGRDDAITFDATFLVQVLPVIIFVSALSAVLFHLRITQLVVRGIAWVMRRTLKTSGAETFGAALLIFLGIESLSAVQAYVKNMTRSEMCTVMTTFMATIAGSVMVVYATAFGAEPGHLLTASLMSAPAAILISKLLVPETGEPETGQKGHVDVPIGTHNVVDAAVAGTGAGLNMALNVAAMIIVFVGFIHLLNILTPALTGFVTGGRLSFTFTTAMGYAFRPVAFLLGVATKDVADVARLLGTKTVLNEFLAYIDLNYLRMENVLSPRSVTIATYALCGFANPGSLGIVMAGMNSLAPERRDDWVRLGWRTFLGGTLACFMTACIAGMLLV